MNVAISRLESDENLSSANNALKAALLEQEEIHISWKKQLKSSKKFRKQQRQDAQINLEREALENRLEELNRESQLEKIAYKKAIAKQKSKVESLEKQLSDLNKPIEELKLERKKKSTQLQNEIFSQFKLLNVRSEIKVVTDIFKEKGEEFPPAGAGDCAGPKLLQFAFQYNLKPVSLAEFWWGKSPKSEVRKNQQFYPPCTSKCAPIMQHMLKHLDVAADPVVNQIMDPGELEIIFEDDWLLVVNKPEQFLSVPGKEISDSVWQRVKQMRPEAEGPLLVHRLDMATSGILLIAKDSETHKVLQSQFIKRTTKKRYVAVLSGTNQRRKRNY